jgi:hypothetical protein
MMLEYLEYIRKQHAWEATTLPQNEHHAKSSLVIA